METVHHFLVVKGSLSERKVRLEEKIAPKPVLPGVANPIGDRVVPLPPRDQLIPGLPKLAVFGIGSMPRPAWLLRMLHEKLEGRITEEEFENAADDAVRLVVSSQESVGVDVLSDGEQRRDTYSSFVGEGFLVVGSFR